MVRYPLLYFPLTAASLASRQRRFFAFGLVLPGHLVLSAQMDEEKPRGEANDSVEAASHQLPPSLVKSIVGSILGALPAGLGISQAAAPGNQGSALYGLLLPWSVLPFAVALTIAWRHRLSPDAGALGRRILVAAILGAIAYGYAFLFASGPINDRQWFAFVPLWQWALLAVPLLKTVRSSL